MKVSWSLKKQAKIVGRKEVSLKMGPLWWFPKTKCDNICLSLMGLTLPLNTSADFYCLLVSGMLPAVVEISTTILIKWSMIATFAAIEPAIPSLKKMHVSWSSLYHQNQLCRPIHHMISLMVHAICQEKRRKNN